MDLLAQGIVRLPRGLSPCGSGLAVSLSLGKFAAKLLVFLKQSGNACLELVLFGLRGLCRRGGPTTGISQKRTQLQGFVGKLAGEPVAFRLGLHQSARGLIRQASLACRIHFLAQTGNLGLTAFQLFLVFVKRPHLALHFFLKIRIALLRHLQTGLRLLARCLGIAARTNGILAIAAKLGQIVLDLAQFRFAGDHFDLPAARQQAFFLVAIIELHQRRAAHFQLGNRFVQPCFERGNDRGVFRQRSALFFRFIPQIGDHPVLRVTLFGKLSRLIAQTRKLDQLRRSLSVEVLDVHFESAGRHCMAGTQPVLLCLKFVGRKRQAGFDALCGEPHCPAPHKRRKQKGEKPRNEKAQQNEQYRRDHRMKPISSAKPCICSCHLIGSRKTTRRSS